MNDLTAGESFRIALKRAGLKQVDLAKETGLDKRNISQTLQNFDKNRGTISTLVQYAESVGFEVEFNFIKKEKV